MKSHRTIAAGTALALLMTAPFYGGTLSAAPLNSGAPAAPQSQNATPPVLLAQASVEELRRRLEEEELTEEERNAIQQQIETLENAAQAEEAEEPAAEEAAPAEEPAAEEAAPEEPVTEEAPAEEAPDEAPAEEEPADEAAGESAGQTPSGEEEAPAEEPAAEEAAPAEEPAAEEAAPEEPVTEEAPADEAAEEAPAEEQPAADADTATDAEADVDAEAEADAEVEAAPEEPAADADAATDAEADAEVEVAPEEPVDEDTAGESAGQTPAGEEEQPATDADAATDTDTEADVDADTDADAEVEAEAEADADAAADADAGAAEEETGEAAPVLDSQKEVEASGGTDAGTDAGTESGQQTGGSGQQDAGVEQAPPPDSDAAAQADAVPDADEVESATADEGTRVEESQAEASVQRRSDAEIIGEIAGRVILSLAGRQVVESRDRDRLRYRADEIYYEELPRGRTREVIVRSNGARVITIRDRYGDIIRRSRITPDGREYILVYAGDRDDDRRYDRWRDPGRDLPPLRLRIPADEYILDARRVDDPDRYYEFLDQPPVERVRRLYSIDEVKYSARVRDTMRRVDLDNITFDFGSAQIGESQIPKLEGLARAVSRMIEENPGETFLVEGHTDAVGTDRANLALSDRRADAVARALTDVFEIPPENLVTQGYGEDYLKVKTEEPNRTNRRVAVRRITPLVAPVASR